ncbi:GIN domain-containing protein [Spirosoma sp.]|uniref:GIN domain-containing protein n=1 Tax=Spirosoma sp. TaxID=1899569 RepID=UPI003B3B7ED5
MKNSAFFLLFACTLSVAANAQTDKYSSQRELRGSDRLVQYDRTLEPFQAINLGQFLSKVTIEVGGTQSVVNAQLDDNLKPFLQIENVNGLLTLAFKDPANKPFWLSKGTIDVTIKTPSLRQLRNESNGDVIVTGLAGESFDLTNQANGNVTLRGVITQLNIISTANGDVRAKELRVQKANIIAQANATIDVNAQQISSQRMGHATIHNTAEPVGRSTIRKEPYSTSDNELVTIILQNNSPMPRTVTLRFTEIGNPTYSVVNTTLSAYGKRRETYPVGTKIEQLSANQQKLNMAGERVNGTLIVTLKANDNGRTYTLPD